MVHLYLINLRWGRLRFGCMGLDADLCLGSMAFLLCLHVIPLYSFVSGAAHTCSFLISIFFSMLFQDFLVLAVSLIAS